MLKFTCSPTIARRPARPRSLGASRRSTQRAVCSPSRPRPAALLIRFDDGATRRSNLQYTRQRRRLSLGDSGVRLAFAGDPRGRICLEASTRLCAGSKSRSMQRDGVRVDLQRRLPRLGDDGVLVFVLAAESAHVDSAFSFLSTALSSAPAASRRVHPPCTYAYIPPGASLKCPCFRASWPSAAAPSK
ncbi:hypothetical protein B0H16DRAFT_118396 [Mycena metata]|uniref:Uncharacterized protein n=1 Tax=Mycena metata TaxID=1033252 RepID=A0AAD7I8M9_9AGAR|nr:hypothetical protein B0H16DRAFT_118396 [Mycena metata]